MKQDNKVFLLVMTTDHGGARDTTIASNDRRAQGARC